jgi:uncharacterized membrane protein
MVLTALEVLGVLLRWLHITSAAVLVGGVVYARAAAVPALEQLPEDERAGAWTRLRSRFRPLVYIAIAGLLLSGLYNYLGHPGHTRYYEIWFGIKMLLAAHVFAASILMVREGGEMLPRRLTSIIISGFFVILVAAYLRRIF